MILIPKYKDLVCETPIVGGGYRIGGEWRLKRYNRYGKMDLDTGWFPNLITNLGLVNMVSASTGWITYWSVGSSATPPAVTDTQQGAFITYVSNSTGVADVKTNSGAPNYIFSHTSSKRWPAGSSGTVRELGLGNSPTNGTGLGIHTAVSPAITKDTDQILDIYYRLNIYPDLIDRTGTIVLDGQTYDWTARGSDLDTSPLWNIMNGNYRYGATYQSHFAYDGLIGTITEIPAGNADSSTNGLSPVSIGSSSGICDYYAFWSVDDGNFGGGIRSVNTKTNFAASAGLQVGFSNQVGGTAIPKTNQQSLKLNFRIQMSRH